MATEYTIRYRFTGQDNTSGERSVDFSKFVATGDTDRNIGQIKSITYIHYHSSDKPMTWNLRGRLMFNDGTSMISSSVGNSISGNVVKFTNTFTDMPTAEQFAKLLSVQTLDSEGKTTSGGYYARLYWRANDTYPMELVVTFIEQPPVTYAPKVDTFSVQRCDSGGSPSDEGERMGATLKVSIGDVAGLSGAQLRVYYAANAYPIVGESPHIDLTARIPELITGVINSASLLPGEWSVSSGWYFSVAFVTGEEIAIATASAPRGSCCFHISDYPGGGVAVCGFSSGTADDPKFESYAPAHFYGPIYAHGGINGMTDYILGEAPTGNKWIDGKLIYRYVIAGTTTLDGADGVVGHIPSKVSTLLPYRGIMQQQNGGNWNSIPTAYYGSSTWTACAYFNPTDNSITLQLGSGYNGTKSFILIFEYTKESD